MSKPKTNRRKQVTIRVASSATNPPRRRRTASSSQFSRRESSLQTQLVLSGAQTARVNKSRSALSLMGNLSRGQKQYMLALRSPFHPGVIGVIVPDFNSRATAPFTIRWKAIMTLPTVPATAVSTQLILVPNPAVFGFLNSGSTLATNAAGAIAVEGQLDYLPNSSTSGVPDMLVDYMGLNRPVFSNQFSQFRVVAGGVRIASLSPLTSNQVVVNTYQVPCVNMLVPYRQINGYEPNLWTGSVTPSQVNDMLLGSNLTDSQLGALCLQSRRSYTGYEIQESPVTLAFQPNNPSAHAFRSSDGLAYEMGQGTGAANFGNETTVNNLGVVLAETNDSSLLANAGWDGLNVVSWTTGSSVVYEVEYVLHCEGIQVVTGYSNNAGFSGSQRDPVNPMYSLDALIGMARQAADYISSSPRLMNGMADLFRASGYNNRRFQSSRLSRLTYQTGEF